MIWLTAIVSRSKSKWYNHQKRLTFNSELQTYQIQILANDDQMLILCHSYFITTASRNSRNMYFLNFSTFFLTRNLHKILWKIWKLECCFRNDLTLFCMLQVTSKAFSFSLLAYHHQNNHLQLQMTMTVIKLTNEPPAGWVGYHCNYYVRGPFWATKQQCALAVCTYIIYQSLLYTIIEVMSLMAFVRANWHCPER